MLLEKFGFGSAELKKFEEQKGEIGSYRDQLVFIQRIQVQYGFYSMYILIDRVDETAVTSNPRAAYDLISPLLTDLSILELDGIAFKFFLWDMLVSDREGDLRPDRIKQYALNWDYSQLSEMLKLRINAFSNSKVRDFHSLIENPQAENVDELIAILADGSPRNMIRLCKAVLDAQSEIDDKAKFISWAAVEKGMRQAAEEISDELYPTQVLSEISRLKRCDFTTKYVYSDVFKIKQQAGLNKVKGWEKSGAILKVGNITETEGARPSFHYAIRSPIVALAALKPISLAKFSSNKIRICKGCQNVVIRDWEEHEFLLCDDCSLQVN